MAPVLERRERSYKVLYIPTLMAPVLERRERSYKVLYIRGIRETKFLTGSFDLKKEIGRRDQIKLLTLFWWVFVDSGNF
jgi:hypothetical protein